MSNYKITMYGRTNSLDEIFKSGTTTPATSNFKQNGTNFDSSFAQYSSGYNAYFTQEFLTNGVTSIPSFPFTSAGTLPFNLNPSFFFTVTGNDTTFTTQRTGYNYGIKFIASNGTIRFNTDTVVNVWMVGGGGGGGRQQALSGDDNRGTGGGGGGSVMSFNFPMKNGITYSFTIGAGGSEIGGDGQSTSLTWTDSTSYTISARGGGGGAAPTTNGSSGGSGGGAINGKSSGLANATPIVSPVGPNTFTNNNIISGPGTNGIPTIGTYSGIFTNGSTTEIFTNYATSGGTVGSSTGGGGGGGASSAGGTNSGGPDGGNGGNGVTIPGTSITVGGGGGGGGGGSNGNGSGGNGGSGGGGRGANGYNLSGSSVIGGANTGGGGGAGGSINNYSTKAGKAGGSGVVYLFF